MTASGGRIAAAASAASAVVGGLDLVAGAAQARPQRAQDLLLVVDDEHALRRSRRTAPARRRPGSDEHERRALAGARLDRRRGRRSPRRSRARSRARGPAPRRVAAARAALERLEDPLALVGRHARAVVDHAHERLRRRRGDLDAHRLARRRVLERVLEQVDEHALDLVGVDADGRRLVGQRTSTRRAVRAELVERAGDELVELDELRLGLGGAGLEAREVEQVLDEVVEPVGGGEDRREQLGAVVVVDREVAAARARPPRSRSPSAASAGRG